MPAEAADGDLLINLGSRPAQEHLGFGWSRGERAREEGGIFQWIKCLEADVWWEVGAAEDLHLWVRAAPLYLPWKRQNVGVYVNGTFLTEWVCPDHSEYSEYYAPIPAEVLKEGRNRLMFRLGFRKRVGRDKRELALAVDKILLRPKGDQGLSPNP
jgi:hypothetical protein